MRENKHFFWGELPVSLQLAISVLTDPFIVWYIYRYYMSLVGFFYVKKQTSIGLAGAETSTYLGKHELILTEHMFIPKGVDHTVKHSF